VHPDPQGVSVLPPDGDGVVEVLGRLRVDREREQVAEVDASLRVEWRRRERLDGASLASLDEQAVEHRLDRLRPAEDALQARAPTRGRHDRQVARAGVAEAFAVDDDRDARGEEGLADDEPSALRDLDD
jgi:hypothetical protein